MLIKPWFFFLIALSAYSFGQNFDLVVTDEVKSKGTLIELHPINHGEFYATRFSRGFQRNAIFLEYYKHFDLKNSKKAPYKVNGSFANFEELQTIGGTPYSFLSDQTDRTRTLFALKMDVALNVLFESEPIIVDPVQRNRYAQESFEFIQSKNREYLAIFINISLKGDNYDTYRYVVLDKNLKQIHKGDFQCVTLSEKTVLSNAFLSNKGIFYLGTKEYELDETRKLIKQYSLLSGMYLYRSKNKKTDHYRIDFTGKVVTETAIFELTNNQLALSGMYRNFSRTDDEGIDGAFYAEIDFNKEKPLNLTFDSFDSSFITEGWTYKEKRSAFRKQTKGKGQPRLDHYKLRDFTFDSVKKTFTGIAEQYYVEERSSADSRGYINTTYLYYYNTLIVYQINENGTFDWTAKIPKVQVSANDYGYLSSIAYLKNNEELILLYNDNQDNYNQNGAYSTEELSAAALSGKKNTITVCTVDLMNGSYERKSLGSISPNDRAILVPKLCEKDVLEKELTIFLSGRKGGQFGYITFY